MTADSEAADKMREWQIRKHSRHKTVELVARYDRAAEEWNESGLKVVEFWSVDVVVIGKRPAADTAGPM